MVVIDQKVAGAAVATVVTSSMSPSVPGVGQTFTVDDDTGYPATGKFVVVVDRGENGEEKILCNSRSGVTFTVGSRGYDGTTATSHTSGTSTIEHALAATVIQFVIDHVDGVESDPHSTKLLNNTRHDIEARHQFGSGLAFGVPVTPTALTPDIAGAAGTGNNPAREDHVHNLPAAVASTITGTNSEGTGGSVARNDHNHQIGGTNHIPGAALISASVTALQLAADSVGATQLATGAVANTADIADGIVTLAKFASEASTDFDPNFDLHNVTLGTGGVQYGRYFKFGRLVFGIAGFALGTGGDVTGQIGYELPFASVDRATGNANLDNHGWVAAARANQGSSTQSGLGVIADSDGLARAFATAGASAVWDAGTPWNWVATSVFQSFFVYEATA